MAAAGYTPEEKAQTESTYKQALEHGIPGETDINLDKPTTADREEVMAGLTKAGTGKGAGLPPAVDPGLLESLRSGFRESPMADYLRKNNPDLVSIGEPGPFQPAPGAKGILENLLHQAGRFGGQPLVIAGGAAGALPLAASMAAQRAWEGSEAGETPGEMARHAAEEGALGLAMGKAGSRMRQAAEVTPASVRAVARQVLPLAAEAETMGAGGEAIQSAEQGQVPFTSPASLARAAEGTQGGLALMGAAHVLHGIMGAGRRAPAVQPLNESGAAETGAGAGSTPPGPGGAETPPSEASEQPRWVEEEGGEGTGAGSTPPGAVEAVSPVSAGGPSLSEEGVGRVLGMGLMRALDSGYVEVDPAGGFTLTDAGLSVVEGRGTGGEQAPAPNADLAAQMETAGRLPVPEPPRTPWDQGRGVAENVGPPPRETPTPMPAGEPAQPGVPSLADRIRAFAQPQFPAAAPVPGATGVPAVVPGQGARTVAEAVGPGLAQVPEEAIPRGVVPSTPPQPPPPGPAGPLPVRPGGIPGAPPSAEAVPPSAGPPEAAAPAPAAGAPSADVVGQLLMKARRLSSTAKTVQDKNFYAGQAQAFEQLLATLRAGESPGKAVAVAGAAPGPPPSEAPAPRRPTSVAPTPLAPRPAAPVEESRDLPPVVPPGPVEPPHPAPGPGAAPEAEEPAERPPTKAEHVAELQEALRDAQREIATEQNPRGEPLSGEDIESAHQFAAELESRLRALGVTPPGMPVLAPESPAGARPSGKMAEPPTATPPGQPEAPAPPSRRAPAQEPYPPTGNLADQPWKWERGVADPPVEEQVAMARLREDDQPAKQAARKLLKDLGWSDELVNAVEAGKVPLPDPRRGLTVDHSLQADMRIVRDQDKVLRRSEASALTQGKLRWADATGKKIGRMGPWRELDLWRSGRPTTEGPAFPARRGSTTLGTGLGALGEFGTHEHVSSALPDPQMESLFVRPERPPLAERLRAKAKTLADAWHEWFTYEHTLRSMPKTKNDFRLFQDAGADAQHHAVTVVNDVLGDLDKGRVRGELDQFERLVGIEDAIESARRGKGTTGGFTHDQWQGAYDDLLKRATPAVKAALQRHHQAMWELALEDVKRGYMPAAVLKKQGRYYPHYVVERSNLLAEILPHLPKELREPYRAWTRLREGSTQQIDFDYVKVMPSHIARVRMAQATDDFAAKVLVREDILPKLSDDERADIFGRFEDGKPKGPAVHLKPYTVRGKEYAGYQYRRFAWGDFSPQTAAESTALDAMTRPAEKMALVPAELAARLRLLNRARDTTLAEEGLRRYMRGYKRLLIDGLGLPFIYRNLGGDEFDLFREDPAALLNELRIPTLARAIMGETKLGKRLLGPVAPEYENFSRILREHRIIEGSTFFGPSVAADLNRLQLARSPAERLKAAAVTPLRWVEYAANVRESWARVAKALTDYERIRAGEHPKAQAIDISGLSPEAALGRLARKAIVDYGEVTPKFKGEIRGLWAPFATWYAQEFENWGRYAKTHPVGFGLKVLMPLAALWWWNNKVTPDVESTLTPWLRAYPWHLNTGYKDPDGKDYVYGARFGSDVLMQIVGVDKLPDALGRLARHEIDGQGFWKAVLSNQITGKTDLFNQLAGPIVRVPQGLLTNRDPFTRKPIVPDRVLQGQSPAQQKLVWQLRAKWLAQQILPQVGQYQAALDRAERRPGKATTKAGRVLEGLLEGPLNPDPREAYRFTSDPTAGRLGKIREAGEEAKGTRAAGLYGVEQGVIDLATGKGPQQLIDAMTESAKGGVALSSEEILRRMKSPAFLRDLFTEKLRRAPTADERERARQILQGLSYLTQAEALKKLPKSTRPMALQGAR